MLKKETIDLMFQNHLKVPGPKYGRGGAVDGDGYSWGGANGTQFCIDRQNKLCDVFMAQTQATAPRPTPTSAALSKRLS